MRPFLLSLLSISVTLLVLNLAMFYHHAQRNKPASNSSAPNSSAPNTLAASTLAASTPAPSEIDLPLTLPTPPPPVMHTMPPPPPPAVPTFGVETRGPSPVRQVGMLTATTDGAAHPVLPLFGKQVYRGSSKWYYYTSTDGYQMMHIPIVYKNKDCTDEYGCEELYHEDEVYVQAYKTTYQVSLYQNTLRYQV